MEERKKLRVIIDELQELEHQVHSGEEVDLEIINKSKAELGDKVDATIHVESLLESREQRLRKMKSQVEEELRWTIKEKDRVRDFLANELDRLGVKKIMTSLHRVTLKLSDWKMNPVVSNKVKTREELGDTDERCIVEETSFRASATFAKQILKETGEIPIGFNPTRKLTAVYKKGNNDG